MPALVQLVQDICLNSTNSWDKMLNSKHIKYIRKVHPTYHGLLSTVNSASNQVEHRSFSADKVESNDIVRKTVSNPCN